MHLPRSTVATALSNQIEVEVDNLCECTRAQKLSPVIIHKEQLILPVSSAIWTKITQTMVSG